MSRPLESDAIDFTTGEVRDIRTASQNRMFHAMCRDLSSQVKWAGALMDEEDWKRMLLAAQYGQRMVPNPLDPTKPFIVVNWKRSRELPRSAMEDLLYEMRVFGDERGVTWGKE